MSAIVLHQMTPERRELLKRTVAVGVTDDEFALFMAVAERSGLDPFQRQIYAVKRWSNRDRREVMMIQTGIDGYRLIAQRTGEYLGQTPPEWCGPDGVWREVWVSDGHPFAARCGVYKRGNPHPIYRVAHWSEYVQTVKDRETGRMVVSQMWERMGCNMIHKCAESLALRAAFPNHMGDIYTEDELSHADSDTVPVLPVRATETVTAPPPLPCAWKSDDDDAGSARMDVQLVALDRKTVRGSPMLYASGVASESSYQFLTREVGATGAIEAAIAGGYMVTVRYTMQGQHRKLVSVTPIGMLPEPAAPQADAGAATVTAPEPVPDGLTF